MYVWVDEKNFGSLAPRAWDPTIIALANTLYRKLPILGTACRIGLVLHPCLTVLPALHTLTEMGLKVGKGGREGKGYAGCCCHGMVNWKGGCICVTIPPPAWCLESKKVKRLRTTDPAFLLRLQAGQDRGLCHFVFAKQNGAPTLMVSIGVTVIWIINNWKINV